MHRFLTKIIILLLLTIFSVSCSSTKTMQGIMSSWVGSDINQVIDQWGFPDEEKVVNERRIFIWHNNKHYYLPQTTTTTGSVNPYTGSFNATTYGGGGQNIYGNCDRILEVDKNKIVKSWEWKGNNCPFAEWMEYKNWRKKTIAQNNQS